MGSEWTVAELCALRHKAVEEYVRVGDDRESWQVDLLPSRLSWTGH
jgi:hypothetical protein